MTRSLNLQIIFGDEQDPTSDLSNAIHSKVRTMGVVHPLRNRLSVEKIHSKPTVFIHNIKMLVGRPVNQHPAFSFPEVITSGGFLSAQPIETPALPRRPPVQGPLPRLTPFRAAGQSRNGKGNYFSNKLFPRVTRIRSLRFYVCFHTTGIVY